LTALAVLNLLLAGLYSLALVDLWGKIRAAETNTAEEAARVVPNKELAYAALLLGVVSVTLLIASALGYLGQKRLLGKFLGITYGLVGLAWTAAGVLSAKEFTTQHILPLAYPLLTLVLLTTVFKDDFPN